jgi:hypothetical protein
VRETEQVAPPVKQDVAPREAVRPGLVVVVKLTESVARPGYPFIAVAVILAVLETPGNSGPKLAVEVVMATSIIVAAPELLKLLV